MPTASNGAEVFTGSGKVYFDRFDSNGNSTGFRFLGSAPKFAVTPAVDSDTVTDYSKKSRGTLAKIIKKQTHTIAITLDEFRPKNLALALLGSAAIFTQTGGAITAEVIAQTAATATIPAPAAGMIIKLANRNISNVVLKTVPSAGGAGTAMSTGDYEIEDAGTGLVRILDTATIPNGTSSITADYTAGAVTATASKTQISVGVTPQIIGAFKLVADPVSGRANDIEVWRAEVTPSGDIGFISEDHGSLELSGEVLNDAANHPNSPYYQTTER